MYYDPREEYTLGGLLPIALALVIAFVVAKLIAFFGLVNKKNFNKWAIFFGSITGVAYSVYMLPYLVAKTELMMLLAQLISAISGGFISWIFYYFAFASVTKDEVK